MNDALRIDRRFNGPPGSGNGGWVGGALARRLPAGAVSVALRAPPPLDRALQLHPSPEGGVRLHDGDTLLAEAQPAALEVEVPSSPGFDAANAAGAIARMRAASRVAGAAYTHCFGCGIAREDGLRIIPGPVGDDGLVATAWTPSAALAEPDGTVGTEVVWAALDCPAGVAWSHQLGIWPAMMTVRMTASVDHSVPAGVPCIVVGWPIARDGRKLHAGTAIFDRSGRILARSLQLWLLPRD